MAAEMFASTPISIKSEAVQVQPLQLNILQLAGVFPQNAVDMEPKASFPPNVINAEYHHLSLISKGLSKHNNKI